MLKKIKNKFLKWHYLTISGIIISVIAILVQVFFIEFIGTILQLTGLLIFFIGAIKGIKIQAQKEKELSSEKIEEKRREIEKIKVPWKKFLLFGFILLFLGIFIEIFLIKTILYLGGLILLILSFGGIKEKLNKENKQKKQPKNKSFKKN